MIACAHHDGLALVGALTLGVICMGLALVVGVLVRDAIVRSADRRRGRTPAEQRTHTHRPRLDGSVSRHPSSRRQGVR